MSGPRVILLGPMGAGKTSVGRELSSLLAEPFTDLDALIVAEAGCTIPEIFDERGEEGFRALEAQTLATALHGGPGVLALGGGTVTHEPTRRLLQGAPTVLLDLDESVAARRIGSGRGRPMLAGEDPLGRWKELTAARMPLYREVARWTVDAGRGNARAVARRIRELLDAEPAPQHPDDRPRQQEDA